MSITNTAKNGVHPEWLLGLNPRAIELQEEKGRDELLNSEELPRKMFTCSAGYIDAKKKYEKIGIKVKPKTNDELFYKVILPKGWKIIATDHHMWSELRDENYKKIAIIFYKAAFYDRRAYIRFEE